VHTHQRAIAAALAALIGFVPLTVFAAAPASAEALVQTAVAEPPPISLPTPEPVAVSEAAPLNQEPAAVAIEGEAPPADAPGPD